MSEIEIEDPKRAKGEVCEALETAGSPEIAPIPAERAASREKDIEYMKAHYEVHPEPALGHPLHGKPQPNPEQQPVEKECDVLHGYYGG